MDYKARTTTCHQTSRPQICQKKVCRILKTNRKQTPYNHKIIHLQAALILNLLLLVATLVRRANKISASWSFWGLLSAEHLIAYLGFNHEFLKVVAY
jgi:hypothetical protein